MEIAEKIQEASSGALDMASKIGEVTHAANETSSGAVQTSTSASELAIMATELQKLVNTFKAE